jgi:predicted flap endonuclease-1-like 5' DNA nuclease
MDKNQGMISCAVGCWLVALLGGILAAGLLIALGSWSFTQGIFIGFVVFGLGGLLLSVMMCRPLPAIGATTVQTSADEPSANVATGSAADAAASQQEASVPAVKPSKQLLGQQDLASRKGEWKYHADGATGAPRQAASVAPAASNAAGEGGPDNLTKIKGVGPKLAAVLNENGIERFDQIARWGADDVKWADESLKGFKGRATRDNWVEQAKALAKG